MLKSILKLNGAQQLSKNEQKNISGGGPYFPPPPIPCDRWNPGNTCPTGTCCGLNDFCVTRKCFQLP